MMRVVLLIAFTAGLAACGQTGALYLPDKSVETPVEIRGPGEPAPAPQAEPDKDKKEEKPAPPPGT
jgi:predicted small lipoprotein YifL